jgi:hypothetical protein
MKKSELQQIIREEISKVLSEAVTVTDWEEFKNPDYVVMSLSNGKKIQLSKKNIKGGNATYKNILTILNTMDVNPQANEFIVRMVNHMISTGAANKD